MIWIYSKTWANFFLPQAISKSATKHLNILKKSLSRTIFYEKITWIYWVVSNRWWLILHRPFEDLGQTIWTFFKKSLSKTIFYEKKTWIDWVVSDWWLTLHRPFQKLEQTIEHFEKKSLSKAVFFEKNSVNWLNGFKPVCGWCYTTELKVLELQELALRY